jgi:hypothetical protein
MERIRLVSTSGLAMNVFTEPTFTGSRDHTK